MGIPDNPRQDVRPAYDAYLLGDSVIVELTKSGAHASMSVKGTLRTIGLKRIGDVTVLANNERNLGMVRKARAYVTTHPSASPRPQKKLSGKKARVMHIRNYKNGHYVGRIATFRTTKEYASLEHYDDYSVLAWTSRVTYPGIVDVARRFLINADRMTAFVGSEVSAPDVAMEVEAAESVLAEEQSVDFVRIDGGAEAFALHAPLEREVGLSLLQLNFLFSGGDQKRMLEVLEETGSPMIRSRADEVLRNLLALKRPDGD